jgi:hypothetical protein
MAAILNQRAWSKRTLLVSTAVLEIASMFKKKVLVELFEPPRQCPQCKQFSEVFVHPTKFCAPCWSSSVLSKVTNSSKKLAAAAQICDVAAMKRPNSHLVNGCSSVGCKMPKNVPLKRNTNQLIGVI